MITFVRTITISLWVLCAWVAKAQTPQFSENTSNQLYLLGLPQQAQERPARNWTFSLHSARIDLRDYRRVFSPRNLYANEIILNLPDLSAYRDTVGVLWLLPTDPTRVDGRDVILHFMLLLVDDQGQYTYWADQNSNFDFGDDEPFQLGRYEKQRIVEVEVPVYGKLKYGIVNVAYGKGEERPEFDTWRIPTHSSRRKGLQMTNALRFGSGEAEMSFTAVNAEDLIQGIACSAEITATVEYAFSLALSVRQWQVGVRGGIEAVQFNQQRVRFYRKGQGNPSTQSAGFWPGTKMLGGFFTSYDIRLNRSLRITPYAAWLGYHYLTRVRFFPNQEGRPNQAFGARTSLEAGLQAKLVMSSRILLLFELGQRWTYFAPNEYFANYFNQQYGIAMLPAKSRFNSNQLYIGLGIQRRLLAF